MRVVKQQTWLRGWPPTQKPRSRHRLGRFAGGARWKSVAGRRFWWSLHAEFASKLDVHYIYIFVYTYIHTYTYTYIYIIYMCIYIYIHNMYVYTNIYIYTHQELHVDWTTKYVFFFYNEPCWILPHFAHENDRMAGLIRGDLSKNWWIRWSTWWKFQDRLKLERWLTWWSIQLTLTNIN